MDPKPPYEPEFNPYAPPESSLREAPADVGSADLAAAEAIRREHISHESSIKAIGALNILGGVIVLIAGAFLLAFGISNAQGREALGGYGSVVGVVLIVLGVVNLAVGEGLRRLRPWARWVNIVLLSLSLLSNTLTAVLGAVTGGGPAAVQPIAGMIIPGYILYLLASRKGGVVFSPGYQDVIALTPHVKMKTSWLVKGCLIVLVAFLVVIVIGAVLSSRNR